MSTLSALSTFVVDKLTTMHSSRAYAVFRSMATQLTVKEDCEEKLRVSRPFSLGYSLQKKKKKKRQAKLALDCQKSTPRMTKTLEQFLLLILTVGGRK